MKLDKLILEQYLKQIEHSSEQIKEKITPDNYYKEDKGKIILSPEEKIFDASYGTEPIFIRIEKLMREEREAVHTIIVNLGTLIRNVIDKNFSFDENVQRIEMEIALTIERIKFLYDNFSVIKYPYLVFYMTNYRKDYQEEKLRPKTPGKALHEEMVELHWEALPSDVIDRYENLTVHFVKLTHGGDYGFQLMKIMRNISTVIPQNNYSGEYYMVSHYPLDYHVFDRCPQGKLINSHTGEVVTKNTLGYKVFRDLYVPFNNITHGVLGDKYQVKPTVKAVSRKKITDLANQNNWHVKTESQIKKDLRNIGIYVE